MAYPNIDYWAALADGQTAPVGEEFVPVFVVDAGELSVPSGKLMCFEPFGYSEEWEGIYIDIPPGRYPVKVTYVDDSDEPDEDHFREAYATLLIDSTAEEATRRIITPLKDGEEASPELDEEESYEGFGVDAATACFVDAEAMARHAEHDDWYDIPMDEDAEGNWFGPMDDPDHICEGVANVTLAYNTEGENIVLVHTGWGDGIFPVVGGFDAAGKLIRVHMDFLVVIPNDDDEEKDE